MLVWVENLEEPENSSNCVITAPKVPPLPVIPDITPNDLQSQENISNWTRKHISNQ